MVKDFITELDKSYSVPTQIAIQAENKPTDMRFNCNTVEDFDVIAEAGMDIRYHGLITTETSTGLTKICKIVDGDYKWEVLSENIEIINDLASGGANKALSAEQGKILKDSLHGIFTISDTMPIGSKLWFDTSEN